MGRRSFNLEMGVSMGGPISFPSPSQLLPISVGPCQPSEVSAGFLLAVRLQTRCSSRARLLTRTQSLHSRTGPAGLASSPGCHKTGNKAIGARPQRPPSSCHWQGWGTLPHQAPAGSSALPHAAESQCARRLRCSTSTRRGGGGGNRRGRGGGGGCVSARLCPPQAPPGSRAASSPWMLHAADSTASLTARYGVFCSLQVL